MLYVLAIKLMLYCWEISSGNVDACLRSEIDLRVLAFLTNPVQALLKLLNYQPRLVLL